MTKRTKAAIIAATLLSLDCVGGEGNGPAYVTGPVRVIGTDVYDLDRDGDGLGCTN